MSRRHTDAHLFWRHPALTFIEARAVQDGRTVCYDRHSHPTFSIGTITGGRSTYWNQGQQWQIAAGAIVLMNPDEVHACNPLDDQPWSYSMFYLDPGWLARRQLGDEHADAADFRPVTTHLSIDETLFSDLNLLFDTLTTPDCPLLQAETCAIEVFDGLWQRLGNGGHTSARRMVPDLHHPRLQTAADYIDAHCTDALRLDDICAACGLSPSYLIRAFKTRYGMTPHAWMTDRRIRYAQRELKRGRPIAEVALAAGFADQAHFQRQFKRRVAATPGQYTAPATAGSTGA